LRPVDRPGDHPRTQKVRFSITRLQTSFGAQIAALEAARDSFAVNATEVLGTIRRIAARILDAAVSAGLADISRSASALLDAEVPDEIVGRMAELIALLRSTPLEMRFDRAVVLLVEDDRLTARVLADRLGSEEIEVRVANDARQARAMLARENVSLVLLDLVLPDEDGRDLLAALRDRSETSRIPVLVLTARADARTQAECFALGANGVLLKPADPEVVLSAVATQLQQTREQRTEARIDRLTGLPNRAALLEAADRIRGLMQRRPRPAAIAMIDIDYFKAVNDTYGHAVGDVVLARAGRRIAETLRISDVTARWGGEEFCVLLPNTGIEGAVIALNKALDAVRGEKFDAPDGTIFTITFSAGIAALPATGAIEPVLAQADRLLYLAKSAGRNRVVSPLDAEQPPRARVLLVEDDDAVATVVGRLLESESLQVVRVAEGAAALDAVAAQPFALVVLDIGLPDMDGFNVLARMRELRPAATLPIVIVTGSDAEHDVVRGFDLGVNDYITKPFHNAELVARVRRFLNRR